MTSVLAQICSPHCTTGDSIAVVGVAFAAAAALWALFTHE